MKDHAPDMLKSTLTAGVIFGTLAGIPYIRLVSCCCLLTIAGGFFASYLYSQECRRQGAPFRPGAGASVGLIAGAFYALTQAIIGTLAVVTIGNPDIRSMLEWMRPYVPPENVTMIDQILAQPDEASLGSLIVEFFVALLVSAVFSTLGGLIGGAVFKQAAAPPDTPVPLDGPPPSAPAF